MTKIGTHGGSFFFNDDAILGFKFYKIQKVFFVIFEKVSHRIMQIKFVSRNCLNHIIELNRFIQFV